MTYRQRGRDGPGGRGFANRVEGAAGREGPIFRETVFNPGHESQKGAGGLGTHRGQDGVPGPGAVHFQQQGPALGEGIFRRQVEGDALHGVGGRLF